MACVGRKKHHKSKGAADAHIRHLKRLNTDTRDLSRLSPYRCRLPGCNEASDGGPGWLVGHDPNQRTLAEEIERKNRNKGIYS